MIRAVLEAVDREKLHSQPEWDFDAINAEEDRLQKLVDELPEFSTKDWKEYNRARDKMMRLSYRKNDPRPLMRWYQRRIPGAFANEDDYIIQPREVEVSSEAIALEPLNSLYTDPDRPMFHGTSWQNWTRISRNGLCNPPAEYATGGDPDYGWRGAWQHEVYNSYMHDLNREQRKKLNTILWIGRRIPKRAFAEVVSLFFVSPDLRVVENYEVQLQVDCTKLRYYWTFADDVLGDEAYVFVMPVECPQAPPSAFKKIGEKP
jgi:hypothetical protein